MKKRIVLSLVLVAMLAFGIGMGTYAWFTDTATSTGNVFEAGTLKISAPNKIAQGLLEVDNLYPSWQKNTTVTIENKGSLNLKYRMSVVPLEDNKLYDGATPLQVSVKGGEFVDIDQLGYVELGRINAGQTGNFNIKFRLPNGADNEYQNAKANFTFLFEATQINNPGWGNEDEELDVTVVNQNTDSRFGVLYEFSGTVVMKNGNGDIIDPAGALVELIIQGAANYERSMTVDSTGEFSFTNILFSYLNNDATLTVYVNGEEVYLENLKLEEY